MRLLVVVALLVGCRGEPKPAPPKQQTTTERVAAEAQGSAAADPWNFEPTSSPDDPPSFVERHKLADTACPIVKAPYFYRIEKAGKTSYILGTRHLGVSLTKFPKPVHDALAAAKLAVFEVAPGDDSDLPQQQVVLRDALGPELWSHYQELVGKQTAQLLESTAPSVAMLAMMAMYEDISATLDVEIEHQVQAAHVPTQGLETAEFQDRLLNQILDLRMLRASIKQTKDRAELAQESKDDLVEYCAGTDDKPGMDDDMRADMRASGYTEAEIDKIDEDMVFTRNAAWIPKLEKLLAKGDVFIAVGADHLSGPKGVVALLAKRGYTLTRVTN
ncbi:MAG TPA: TraB/GumN family protein [Kofleriaceae bacterium]